MAMFFWSHGQPRVLLVGVTSGLSGMATLAHAVNYECANLGPLSFPQETRPYKPHVTLGRVRRQRRTHRGGKIEIDTERYLHHLGERLVNLRLDKALCEEAHVLTL